MDGGSNPSVGVMEKPEVPNLNLDDVNNYEELDGRFLGVASDIVVHHARMLKYAKRDDSGYVLEEDEEKKVLEFMERFVKSMKNIHNDDFQRNRIDMANTAAQVKGELIVDSAESLGSPHETFCSDVIFLLSDYIEKIMELEGYDTEY